MLASEVAAGTHPGVAPGATPGATLVTEVARHRFELYRQEEHRQRAQQGAAGSNRDEFLRALGTRVSMDQPTGDDMARIHELVQRTNRLNWTGHRYHRPEIEALLADSDKVRCWVIRAADRFGDYGLVGFAVVRVDAPECWRIRDLMFSCRILDREVDLFALTQIFQCAADQGTARVVATFRPSAHNEAAAATLRAAGLKATAEPSLFSITLADGWPVVEHIDRDASRP